MNFLSGGKPITPTGDQNFMNGSVKDSQATENGTTVIDGATKLEVSNGNWSLVIRNEESLILVVQKHV